MASQEKSLGPETKELRLKIPAAFHAALKSAAAKNGMWLKDYIIVRLASGFSVLDLDDEECQKWGEWARDYKKGLLCEGCNEYGNTIPHEPTGLKLCAWCVAFYKLTGFIKKEFYKKLATEIATIRTTKG